MAWGFWTTYSANRHVPQNSMRALSPPTKIRERSLDRESNRVETERQLLRSSSSGSIHGVGHGHGHGHGNGHGNGSVIMDRNSGIQSGNTSGTDRYESSVAGSRAQSRLGLLNNHIPPEKVAYERHLLLGDPDWSNRTIADRNTLPRKKGYGDYSGGSVTPPEDVYYPSGGSNLGNKSPMTPGDTSTGGGASGSRKSSGDEVFCPACAHHSQQQLPHQGPGQHSSSAHNSSNRESRVSFGSIASSSRGSRGSSGGAGMTHQPPAMVGGRVSIMSSRVRSRSQEDDDESSGGILSSSVPTPPPPPFLSNRDIIHSSLMETINQKMSMLSSIRNSMPPNSHLGHGGGHGGHGGRGGASYQMTTTTMQHAELQYHEQQLKQDHQEHQAGRHSRRNSGKESSMYHNSGSYNSGTPPAVQRSVSSKMNNHHNHRKPHQSSSLSLRDSCNNSGPNTPLIGQTTTGSLRHNHSSNHKLHHQSSADNTNTTTTTTSHPRSSRSSSRTTPRGSSSRASHESIKSIPPTPPATTAAKLVATTPPADGSYERMGDSVDDVNISNVRISSATPTSSNAAEKADAEFEDNQEGGSVIGIRLGGRSNTPASSSNERNSRSHSQTPDEDGGDEDDEDEDGIPDEKREERSQTGTVRRKKRRSSTSVRLSQEVLAMASDKLSSSQEQIELEARQAMGRVPFVSRSQELISDHPGYPHPPQLYHNHPPHHQHTQSQHGSRKSSKERLDQEHPGYINRPYSRSQERIEDYYHYLQQQKEHLQQSHHSGNPYYPYDRPHSRSQERLERGSGNLPGHYRRSSYDGLETYDNHQPSHPQYRQYYPPPPPIPPPLKKNNSHSSSSQEKLDNNFGGSNSRKGSRKGSSGGNVGRTDNGHWYTNSSSLKRGGAVTSPQVMSPPHVALGMSSTSSRHLQRSHNYHPSQSSPAGYKHEDSDIEVRRRVSYHNSVSHEPERSTGYHTSSLSRPNSYHDTMHHHQEQSVPPPPQRNHVSHYRGHHNEGSSGGRYLRPRSASIGDRLSDSSDQAPVEPSKRHPPPRHRHSQHSMQQASQPSNSGQHFTYQPIQHPRKHHTLDSRSGSTGKGILRSTEGKFDRHLPVMSSFLPPHTMSSGVSEHHAGDGGGHQDNGRHSQMGSAPPSASSLSAASSRTSEKSSSRSSQSPSIENVKMGVSKNRTRHASSSHAHTHYSNGGTSGGGSNASSNPMSPPMPSSPPPPLPPLNIIENPLQPPASSNPGGSSTAKVMFSEETLINSAEGAR